MEIPFPPEGDFYVLAAGGTLSHHRAYTAPEIILEAGWRNFCMMGTESKYIWVNGEMLEYGQAHIHLLSPALHYGAAVFEGIRAYRTDKGTAVFRLPEHAERLIESAEILGFREMPFTTENISDAVKLTVRSNELEECYIRPLLYLDGPATSLVLDSGKPSLMIAAWAWDNYLGEEALQKGVRANISSYTRHHPNASMTKAKISGNYANSILAKTESARLGFQEAIMLDPEGYVAECTGENLFMVRKGRIFTAHTAPVLEGITRDTIVKLASDLGYQVTEQPITRDQLYAADEVFVCGTAAEVAGITEINFRKIGPGEAGPVTRQLQKQYADAVHGRLPGHENWCDLV
jgi:branched-chain amino acid aminotransferase